MDINGHLKDVSLRRSDAAEARAAMDESSENDTHSSAHVQKYPANWSEQKENCATDPH